jgi:hypothetical protein
LVKSQAHAKALEKAWVEVLTSLKQETEEVVQGGASLIPVVQYPGDDLVGDKKLAEWLDSKILESVKKRGTVIVKGVVPEQEALGYKQSIRDYVTANPQTKGFPAEDPQVYELYWSKAQLAARSHPSLLKVSEAFLSLFHAPSQTSEHSGFDEVPPAELSVSLSNPLTYCDRLRIRLPGDSKFALGPHIDGGGVERWEDETFRGVWSSILEMSKDNSIDWRNHDSWSLGPLAQRLGAKTDMYNGAGACSVFRPFQGWLSMSSTSANEGTLRVLPLLQSASAYIILRPFFEARKSLSACSKGEQEYLAADNWTFSLDNPHFHGCSLGRNIELSAETHPHLRLDETMTSIPRVDAGDCALWHCDVVHAVEKEHKGAPGKDSSVLYIPSIPLTKASFDYVLSQRQSFVEGIPPSDFPGGEGESTHIGRGKPQDITNAKGRRAMGLEKFKIRPDMSRAEVNLIETCNAQL